MADVLSPSGVELPLSPEQFSRALVNRNFTRLNDLWAKALTTDVPYGHAGRTAGFQTIGAADVAVGLDVAQRLAGGMTFETAASGRFVIPKSGQYWIITRIYATGGTGYASRGGAYVNSVKIAGSDVKFWKGDASDFYNFGISRFYFNAGDKVGLGMDSPAGASTWGTDGYNGSWLELWYASPNP